MMKVTNALIVTRHPGTVEWLRRRGITGDVVPHATADQVRGRVVYGVLPLYLAALAECVWSVDIPASYIQRRAPELSADDLEKLGTSLSCYVVRRVRKGLELDQAHLRKLGFLTSWSRR